MEDDHSPSEVEAYLQPISQQRNFAASYPLKSAIGRSKLKTEWQLNF